MNREMMRALEADGEKLRQLTGEDHGPWGICDGCGASVPLDQLSLATFTEGEGFVCEECKRETVVVSLASDKRQPE